MNMVYSSNYLGLLLIIFCSIHLEVLHILTNVSKVSVVFWCYYTWYHDFNSFPICLLLIYDITIGFVCWP